MIESQPSAASGNSEANPVLTLRSTPAAESVVTTSGLPAAPAGMEDIGLSPSFLLELTLKVIHYADSPTTEHIARVIALPAKLVEALLESLKSDKLCEIVGGGSTYDLSTNYRFRLTERGEARAEQALERCRYAGAAPVTIAQYQRVTGQQNKELWRPSEEAIQTGFSGLVVEEAAAALLTRALRSGRCAMVFGPSGNGKTHLLAEFVRHLEGEAVVPYTLYAYGQIIRVFDQTVHVRREPVHKPAETQQDAEPGLKRASGAEDVYDRRWIRIQRPGVIVGGELTSESLELGYDPITKFYQAPKHLKAQGGVLLVDDFGRQRIGPAELLNRWIMALERGTDNLLLRTGESIEVPFDVRLLFSTNLDPTDLADAAFLRRIPYKVQMPPTSPAQFAQIIGRICQDQGVTASPESIGDVVSFIVDRCDHPLSGALARDLVMIILDNATQDGRPAILTVDAVAIAFVQFTGTLPDGYDMPGAHSTTPAQPATPEPTLAEVAEPPPAAADEPESAETTEETTEEAPARDPSLAELAARIAQSSEVEPGAA